MIFWIPCYSRTSTALIRIIPYPEAVGTLRRQEEPPLGESVMSEMSHCHNFLHHLSHQPPLTPDLTHLCSDHLHLPISNQVSLISTLHSVIHCPVYRSLARTVPNTPVLLTCVTYLPVYRCLSSDSLAILTSMFLLDLGLPRSCHPAINIISHYSAGYSQDCHQYLLLTCLYSPHNPIYHLFNKPACVSPVCDSYTVEFIYTIVPQTYLWLHIYAN